jgi:hypothetical protein
LFHIGIRQARALTVLQDVAYFMEHVATHPKVHA